jgi:hypothetical protein
MPFRRSVGASFQSASGAPGDTIGKIHGSAGQERCIFPGRLWTRCALEQFLALYPERHVTIEGFFAPEVRRSFTPRFPDLNPALAKNEIYGGVWGKAVNTKIREISPAYEELYATIGSREFLSTSAR